MLKQESPNTVVVASEPDNSQLLASGIAQDFLPDGSPAASHSGFRPHLMQGWSPDFIPKLANDVIEQNLVDRIVPVSGAQSLKLARELARREGILCGITSGATYAAALEIAKTAPKGSSILCMLPDTGERYLSTALFDEVTADMNDAEIHVSQSTPRYRFDVPSVTAPAQHPVESVAAKAEAVAFVETVTHDAGQPVVMFALEWCEFCWSVRKLFAEIGIPFRSIDLDSVAYQTDDRGGDIRAALRQLTGSPTIPQIYIGGTHMGGCTETFDAFNDGRLQDLLVANQVAFDQSKRPDAYQFLPAWLHPR